MPTIQFKTITQQSFHLDLAADETIASVKEKIAKEKGQEAFPLEGQKLIYNGKVLEDTQTISEVNVAEGKFIVVMVMKKSAAKAGSIAQGGSGSATSSDAKDQKNEGEKKAASPTDTSTVKQVPPLTAEHAKVVDEIVSMGYPKEEVIRACQAAFFNADRAVEYLCTGIPEGMNLNQGAAEEQGENEEGGATEGELLEGLGFLANSPQFQQLRDMVRSDPTALPQIVQQIAEHNPQLMELIRNNQAQFLELLNSEPSGEGGAVPAGQVPTGGNVQRGAAVPHQQQRIVIPLTQEDRDAIDRLRAMGFPEHLAIEAYLACDKNEGLAVNYILQRMDEDQQ